MDASALDGKGMEYKGLAELEGIRSHWNDDLWAQLEKPDIIQDNISQKDTISNILASPPLKNHPVTKESKSQNESKSKLKTLTSIILSNLSHTDRDPQKGFDGKLVSVQFHVKPDWNRPESSLRALK